MKIIRIDNFNRDESSDDLIADNIINKEYGKNIVDFLNSTDSGDYAPYFYKMVDDDCVLYTYEP